MNTTKIFIALIMTSFTSFKLAGQSKLTRYLNANNDEVFNAASMIESEPAFNINLHAFSLDPKINLSEDVGLIQIDSPDNLNGNSIDTFLSPSTTENEANLAFSIGTSWTYGTIEDSGNPRQPYYKFERIQIKDTVSINDRKIYALSNSDSLYMEKDKMFFWDKNLKSYEMHYDFNSRSEYQVRYWNNSMQSIQFAKVNVDSIYSTIINLDTIPTQLLRISNNGSYENDIIVPVYKNIGASYFEIKLYLGKGVFDPPKLTTALRCFENGNKVINFQSYPCDSTWLSTNTIDLGQESISIYPNPTAGRITIQGIDNDVPYVLYDLQGEIIEANFTIRKEIELPASGIYILKLKMKNTNVWSKVIRV